MFIVKHQSDIKRLFNLKEYYVIFSLTNFVFCSAKIRNISVELVAKDQESHEICVVLIMQQIISTMKDSANILMSEFQ